MVLFMIESSTPSNGIKCKGMMRVHSFLDDCVQGYHRNGMCYFNDVSQDLIVMSPSRYFKTNSNTVI